MFIYIVIDESKSIIGTFIDIEDARKHKKTNYKIIKSRLVGESDPKNDMKFPDVLNKLFGGIKKSS